MKFNLQQLFDQRKAALDEATAIVTKAETENRDLNADEEKRYGELMAKAKDLEKRANRAKDLDAQHAAAAPVAAGTPAAPAGTETRFSAPNVQTADKPRYSVLRALRCIAERRSVDGYEGEVSAEIAKRSGKSPQGFWMPFDFNDPFEQRSLSRPVERRDFNLTTGNDLKPTIVDASNFIELLRNRMVVRALGARILAGLTGDLSIPTHSGASTAYWFDSEAATVTESNQTTGQVALAPSTVGAQTDISRKLLLQTSLDAEAFVREDLAQVIALEIDRAAINGSGSGAEPEGILQNSSVPAVALGAAGDAPTWAAVVGLESEVAVDNALVGSLAYVTNAKGVGKLKTTPKVGTTYPIYLMGDDAKLNGYPVVMSNQVPANLTKSTGENLSAMIFGNWADVLIGFWSGVDVIADPYSGAASGTLKITMLQDCDIALRHAESFAKIVDMVTT